MKKNDWLIIIVVIFIAGIIYLYDRHTEEAIIGEKLNVEIYFDGELYDQVSLDEYKEIIIETELGINVIEVNKGKVKMIEADCPDHVCINSGSISRPNQYIICLPNKVHVNITGEMEDELDAISE